MASQQCVWYWLCWKDLKTLHQFHIVTQTIIPLSFRHVWHLCMASSLPLSTPPLLINIIEITKQIYCLTQCPSEVFEHPRNPMSSGADYTCGWYCLLWVWPEHFLSWAKIILLLLPSEQPGEQTCWADDRLGCGGLHRSSSSPWWNISEPMWWLDQRNWNNMKPIFNSATLIQLLW